MRNVLATYSEAEDLVNIGAYKDGSNPEIDFALSKIGEVNEFLRQDVYEKFDFAQEVQMLEGIFEAEASEAE